jgi:hypothetical protein
MSKDDAFSDFFGGEVDDEALNAIVRFDERQDVLASLDLLKLITPLLEECPGYWKWTLIAAHSALQGAMVCALVDTTGVSVLRKSSAREVLTWLEADIEMRGKPPKECLADFVDLFERCRKRFDLKLTSRQLQDIVNLNNTFRNNFVHFTPSGWAIEKVGLPRMIGSALHGVENLISQPRVLVHLDEDDQLRLTTALNTIEQTWD